MGPGASGGAGLLGREELLDAFGRMAALLRRRGVVGHLYLLGGAAMALAYDAERITLDADALIVDAHGPVLEAAERVARELGLPRGWLNEQASVYLPAQDDRTAPVVFDDPHLRVTAASARFVLAMKLRAARPRDLDDLRRLAERLGLTELVQLEAVHDEVFPDDPLPPRTRERVRVYWSA